MSTVNFIYQWVKCEQTQLRKFSHDFQQDLAAVKVFHHKQFAIYGTSMLTFLTIAFVLIPLMPRTCAAVVPIDIVLPTYKI